MTIKETFESQMKEIVVDLFNQGFDYSLVTKNERVEAALAAPAPVPTKRPLLLGRR